MIAGLPKLSLDDIEDHADELNKLENELRPPAEKAINRRLQEMLLRFNATFGEAVKV